MLPLLVARTTTQACKAHREWLESPISRKYYLFTSYLQSYLQFFYNVERLLKLTKLSLTEQNRIQTRQNGVRDMKYEMRLSKPRNSSRSHTILPINDKTIGRNIVFPYMDVSELQSVKFGKKSKEEGSRPMKTPNFNRLSQLKGVALIHSLNSDAVFSSRLIRIAT